MKRLLAFIAILAGLAGTAYSAFFIWFIAMMRGWSHVRDPGGDSLAYLAFAAGLLVSAFVMYWGVRQLRRPKAESSSLPED